MYYIYIYTYIHKYIYIYFSSPRGRLLDISKFYISDAFSIAMCIANLMPHNLRGIYELKSVKKIHAATK